MKQVARASAILLAVAAISACAGAASGAKSSTTKPKTTKRVPTTRKPKPASTTAAAVSGVRLAKVKVLRTIPKDPTAFTQGLEVHNGVLYESTGIYGQSEMRSVDLQTGQVLKRVPLDAKLFAEGSTVLPDGTLVQLTWREQVAVVRNLDTLAETKRFSYTEEGWGICFSKSAQSLVHSDGSNSLLLRDAETFAKKKSVTVTDRRGLSTSSLNELECEGSSVFANLWTQDRILEIDIATGNVVREIDASSISKQIPNRGPDDVLNGIAALGKGRYLLTGKRFPAYYEVEFIPSA